MSVNDDEVMLKSAFYHGTVELLVNTLASDLKRELREVLLSELRESHLHVSLLIERLVKEVSGSAENKSRFLHACELRLEGHDCEVDDKNLTLLNEVNHLRSENIILKKWISELESKGGRQFIKGKQKLDVEFSISSQAPNPERALGLDFSLPDEHGKG